ncbi:MAG: 3-keto-disaccharide hydrolase [Phycisphaerales bacterium]
MLAAFIPTVASIILCSPLAEPTPPAVTPVDAAAGWKLYSGPDAAKQWRGFKQAGFPDKGWTAANGTLSHAAGAGGGDIITADQFDDFEIACQFKLAPKANSGIIFRVAEKHDATWQTGPEFQVFADTTGGAKPTDSHSAGALYGLYPPGPGKVLRPAGQLNDARIWLRNGVLQHWLNGVKLVDVVIFDASGKPTPEWLAKIAASKFKEYEGFGLQPKGHIALQDHGDEVLYSDIKIRDLGAPMPGEKVLFNGKDLTGWMPVVPDLIAKQQDPAQVWEVKDGILICKGNPVGYIRTTDKYTNFVLKLQWRFNPVTKRAGNSGVLLRMVGDEKVWPKSVEAQLQSGSAGDFWNIDNVKMKTDAARTNGRNTKKTHGAERPVGEWNEYEIIVNKGDVILKVNGEELNRATDVEEVPGYICLQSEGAEIQFRDIRIVPLP